MFKKKNKEKKKDKKKDNIFVDVAEIILAVFAAWLFYQGMSFALGTPMPIVSVVSWSMYHDHSFDNWWDGRATYYQPIGINKTDFESFPMANGLSRGDLLVVSKSNYKVGDVVIYGRSDVQYTIVHRIVAEKDGGFLIKGDNNAVPDPGVVRKEQILGKVNVAVPILGYPRLVLYAVGI